MPLSQTTGSRAQVMHGTAKKTSGGLTKSQLKYNKQGKIVSKKASALAKKNNRLVKAGYITRKGVFGVEMSGGAGWRGVGWEPTNNNNNTNNNPEPVEFSKRVMTTVLAEPSCDGVRLSYWIDCVVAQPQSHKASIRSPLIKHPHLQYSVGKPNPFLDTYVEKLHNFRILKEIAIELKRIHDIRVAHGNLTTRNIKLCGDNLDVTLINEFKSSDNPRIAGNNSSLEEQTMDIHKFGIVMRELYGSSDTFVAKTVSSDEFGSLIQIKSLIQDCLTTPDKRPNIDELLKKLNDIIEYKRTRKNEINYIRRMKNGKWFETNEAFKQRTNIQESLNEKVRVAKREYNETMAWANKSLQQHEQQQHEQQQPNYDKNTHLRD